MGGERPPSESEWEIVKAINPSKGQAQVFRLRRKKPRGKHMPRLLTAVSIRWPYDPSSVFPKGQDKEAILAFERATDSLAEENDHSELVVVATGMGVKEWLYYVDDPSWFVETLNRLLEGHEQYPISIEWSADPQWRIWQEMIDAVADREAQ